MKATLHLQFYDLLDGRVHQLRRRLDDVPPVLFPGVDVALIDGGPLNRVRRTTFDLSSRALNVHLENFTRSSGGLGSYDLADFLQEGWEEVK
jgi:hypothetical protein